MQKFEQIPDLLRQEFWFYEDGEIKKFIIDKIELYWEKYIALGHYFKDGERVEVKRDISKTIKRGWWVGKIPAYREEYTIEHWCFLEIDELKAEVKKINEEIEERKKSEAIRNAREVLEKEGFTVKWGRAK